jgi:hypothetical protein
MNFLVVIISLSIILEIIGVVIIISENIDGRKRRGLFFLAVGFLLQIFVIFLK